MPSGASLVSSMTAARVRPVLVALALLAPGARPAAAQGWPFMFTVTTEPASADDRWIARYEGGYGDRSARTTQEVELLKDLLAPTRRVGVAMGLGLRRERPLEQGRDAVDLLTTLGWRHRFGPVHLGVEAVGEDLEGFWEGEEAEGGAKLFVGPSIHLAPAGRAWSASLCGGPILYATRSGRSSPAVRPLEATANGFTMRFAVAYSF
jgi:hypothetical protein